LYGVARGRKAADVASGLFGFLSRFLLLSIGLGFFDFLFHPSRSLRITLWLLFAASLCVLAGRLFVRSLLRPVRPETDAARLDDRIRTGDAFVNAFGLHTRPEDDLFVSGLMTEAETHRRRARIRDWLDLRPLRSSVLSFLLLSSAFAALMSVVPKDVLYHASRMLSPWSGREAGLFSFRYSVDPGDKGLPAGSSCTVLLTASEPLSSCRITASGIRGEKLSGEMSLLTNSGPGQVYSFRFRELDQDVRYSFRMVTRARKMEFESAPYLLRALRAPVLADFSVRYDYPPHTGLPASRMDGAPDLEAPAGTIARISAEADQPILAAGLDRDGNYRSAEFRGTRVFAVLRMDKSGEYAFRIKGKNGMTNAEPARYAIRILPDLLPEVAITSPGRDTMVPPTMELDVTVEAKDDYRIRTLELAVYRQEAYGERFFPTNHILLSKDPGPAVRVTRTIRLEEQGLSPGETLFYFALADDGHPSGNHKVASPVYAVRFPSLEDIYRSADQTVEEGTESLRRAKELQAEFLKKTDEIREKIRRGSTPDYTERKQMEAMLERQQELSEELRNAAERMDQAVESMSRERTHSAEIAQKMRDIQKLVQEVADQEMMRSVQDMESLLDQVNLSEQDRRNLGDRLDQERLLRKLDNTLKMLEEIKSARRMNELSRRADRLVERQREINEKTEQAGDAADEEQKREIAARQEENRRSLDELAKEMDTLAQEQAGKDPQAAQDLRKAAEDLRKDDPAGEMNAASEAVKKNDPEEARRRQNRAMSGLMNLQKNLNQASKRKNKDQREDAARLVAEIYFQLAGLASEQGRLVDDILRSVSAPDFPSDAVPSVFAPPGIRVDRSVPLTEQVFVLEKLVAGLKKTVRQDLEKSASVPQEFYDQFDEAAGLMVRVRRGLDANDPASAAQDGRRVLAVLNRIMLQFQELSKKMNAQNEGSEGGEGQESMEGLSSSQESLNKSTQRMQGRSGQQGISPSDQTLLKELAYQQEMIQSAFQDLMQGAEQSGTQGMMGDMEGIAKEMAEAVRKMNAGQVDEDLIQRQNRILQKMLDSQRALKTREESPERKADRPTRSVAAPAPDVPDTIRKRTPDDTSREKYPPQYRSIVERYLQLLKE
jgi:hypothetical protein